MKIALVATEKLPVPAIRGGAIQIYLQSFTPIVAKNHDVTVISISDPELPERETVEGVRHIHIDRNDYVAGVAEFLSREAFDVVHVCNRPEWVTAFHRRAPDSGYVLSVHNEMFAEGKISRQEGEKCISIVSKMTTVSDYIGQTIIKRFPDAKEKITTVHSGVDLQTYRPSWTPEGGKISNEMRREFSLEGKKVVLFVGRLSKVKGPHLLLQALPEIIQKHPDTVMVFVGSKWFGDDDVNNYVKYLYTLGALYPENVVFIKFVQPDDIHKLYTMADVFVCSSQWQEPLARVHYEAMAAGLPVITTNRGGNAEVIRDGHNGFVMQQYDDITEYTEKITRLLDDPALRNRLGEAGRKIVEERFGWDTVASRLERVYKEAQKK